MFIPNLKGPEKEEQYSDFTFLDKGGMGQVYEAFDNHNNINVAIKFIPIRNEDEEKLLSREIKVSQEIESENLVKTYFVEKIELTGTEYFYIVQHFYEQGNLRTIIQKDIPYDKCLKMFLDLLNGLKVLHAKIIHRDLKPENILIGENNLVITDFGLAKFIDEKTKTKSFKGAGTIPYKSPECWLNQDNKIQMDIYSLGIIFYELLTGEFPFNAQTEEEWRENHLFVPLPNISDKRKEIPIKIQQVVSKMTNKRASDRYSNVEEIIESIQKSIIQSEERDKGIERLASISHKRIEEVKAEKLKEEEEQKKYLEFRKNINFHIKELKERIKATVNTVNAELEEDLIVFVDSRGSSSYRIIDKFNISVDNKYAFFEFYETNTIKDYEERRIYRIEQNQIERAGSIGASKINQENIIFIGKVSTNYLNSKLNSCYGYNLLLVKGKGDIYGKWYIASFSDNGINGMYKREFSLDLDKFLVEFEKCFVMHNLTVDFQELKDIHINRLLEEIISL